MGKAIAAVLVVGLLVGGVVLSGCAGGAGSSAAMKCAGCSEMMASGKGWCAGCNKGMINGQEVKCKGCYTAKTGGPACAKCSSK